jgi:hypothetical protein
MHPSLLFCADLKMPDDFTLHWLGALVLNVLNKFQENSFGTNGMNPLSSNLPQDLCNPLAAMGLDKGRSNSKLFLPLQ